MQLTHRQLHEQKQILHLICRRCVLTQALDILCLMPSVCSDLCRNVPYVLTQPRVLPTSRLPQTPTLIVSATLIVSPS